MNTLLQPDAAARPELYRPRAKEGSRLKGFGVACLITLGIFSLVPLTQLIEALRSPPDPLRSFELVTPPPPPPPQFEDPPEPPREEPPPPEMREPPPPMQLSQLNFALTPGIGDAGLGGSLGLEGFSAAPDLIADLQIYDVKDLDERPRAIGGPRYQAPFEARRDRIRFEIRVRIVITEEGRVVDPSIVESNAERFNSYHLDFVRQLRYTPPLKNGEPVRAAYTQPFKF